MPTEHPPVLESASSSQLVDGDPVERPFTVAIVDDDPAMLRLLRLLMRRNGFRVITATNAENGRRLLTEKEWDLAILDRRLPDLDGALLCAEIKNDPNLQNRYLILLTASSTPSQTAEGLEMGADDYVAKPFQSRELIARVKAGKRIIDLQKELLAANDRLRVLATTDDLTQLYNRRQFRTMLSRVFDAATRYGRPLSLAIIDIDHFKSINDTFGHDAGDQVLRQLAQVIMKSIRSSDFLARIGGEEFGVILPETDAEEARHFGEKIRRCVEQVSVSTGETDIKVQVSIGVAGIPYSRFEAAIDLLKAADRALYRAKANGRNRVEIEQRRNMRPASVVRNRPLDGQL